MSNVTIWKYVIKCKDAQSVELPKGAKILTLQMQYGLVCIWAEVDPDATLEDVVLLTVGTSHSLPLSRGKYIGTYQLEQGALVFHVYEANY